MTRFSRMGKMWAFRWRCCWGCTARAAGHVTIGHRLSTRKKQVFFQFLKAQRRLDKIFVYAQSQYDWAVDRLRLAPEKLDLIPFHADDRFYRPLARPVNPNQICSAGLEWRDYPTLIAAVADLPELSVKLAAASPWSKHQDETAGRVLPPNVDARRYDYLVCASYMPNPVLSSFRCGKRIFRLASPPF